MVPFVRTKEPQNTALPSIYTNEQIYKIMTKGHEIEIEENASNLRKM